MLIMVVENSALLVERWQEILMELDETSTVFGAVNYHQAWKIFQEKAPQVVLLDAGLSGSTWSKLLLEIKAENMDTKVVVMTICIDDFVLQECKVLGADYLIDKYLDFDKVPQIISNINCAKNGYEY